jgi:hypothetical protein
MRARPPFVPIRALTHRHPADANRLLLMLSLTPGRGPAPWLSNGTRFHRPTCDAGRQRACGRGLRDPHRPTTQAAPGSVMHQDVRCLIEGSAYHFIAAAADMAVVVDLSGAVASRRQTKMRSNISGTPTPGTVMRRRQTGSLRANFRAMQSRPASSSMSTRRTRSIG